MSERKQAAAQRRDERNVKDDTRPHSQPGKKDKKKWCRGKVGVEHTPKCMNYGSAGSGWKELVCTGCSKRLSWYFPFLINGKLNGEPPAWVTEEKA